MPTIPATWFTAPDAEGTPTIWDGPKFRAVVSAADMSQEGWAAFSALVPAAVLDESGDVVMDDGQPVTVPVFDPTALLAKAEALREYATTMESGPRLGLADEVSDMRSVAAGFEALATPRTRATAEPSDLEAAIEAAVNWP